LAARYGIYVLALSLYLVTNAACVQKMADEPRYKPLAESTFWDDGASARPLVPGTVARGHLDADTAYYTGKIGGKYVDTFPLPVTRATLERGRARFEIYCAPCHGRLGDGDGMVVERGFRGVPSYHEERFMRAPIGQFFDVIANGYGAMASYAARVPVEDRWAIIAYIRALQYSQAASLSDLKPEERRKLEGMAK
jgi:hypothetical protein